MTHNEKFFAFDMGKASLGICAREGDHLLALKSLIIPAEFASTQDFRTRRRAFRTRQAHYKREAWLRKLWEQAGLTPLASDDKRLQREFPKKSDDTLYNSALLRIALLQERPLQEWQIFKALWSSIQKRGYDNECDWRLKDSGDEEGTADSDEKENQDSVNKYKDDLGYHTNSQPEYLYPCYLEASLMGLWHLENPKLLKARFEKGTQPEKVRTKGRVAPRQLVEKEVRQLFENAKKQLPQLSGIDTNEFLYGPGKTAYASLTKTFARKRGTEWDAQGVLSQKVPRFDNRIIAKCQLMPTRNVCKASDPLHYDFVLLSKLKNLRFTDENGEYNRGLFPDEFLKAFEKAKELLDSKKADELTFLQIQKDVLAEATGMKVYLLSMRPGDKLKINTSGRSRFCRPALRILNAYMLAGKNPSEFDASPYITADDPKRGTTRQEVEAVLKRVGETWEKFHIADSRYEDLATAQTSYEKRQEAITKLIGSSNNPVVRHRLTVFWNELKALEKAHGKPDRVILEFVRGDVGLTGAKTANEFERMIKDNEKANDVLRQKLDEHGYRPTKNMLTRLKLLVEQGGICPYTGKKLEESQLDTYDIDHIVPITSDIAADSLYNKVLCIREANREKSNRTPYEWLKDTDQWPEYLARITDKNNGLGSKKRQLLTRADARDLVTSYNGLAETAYLARLAQTLVALHFGWGLQTKDDNRRVFVNDGKITAKIRQIYKLNDLLLSPEEQEKLNADQTPAKQREVWKKNRSNHKHHALDAYCISYSQELKVERVDDRGFVHWHAPGVVHSKAQMERMLLDLFPNNIRRNTKELYPLETIYGLRERLVEVVDKKGNKTKQKLYYLTVQKSLVDLIGKERKKIKDVYDTDVQADLAEKSELIKDAKEWVDFLKTYRHPKRKSLVKNLLMIESESDTPPKQDESGRWIFGEFKDYGNGATRKQFKHTKANKGQFIYNDGKRWKVQQVLSHDKTETVKQKLLKEGFTLYKQGILLYPGCRIFIPKPFKAGSVDCSAGLYKSRTIQSNGQIKLENPNGEELLSNIKYLVEAGFTLADYHDMALPVSSVSAPPA